MGEGRIMRFCHLDQWQVACAGKHGQAEFFCGGDSMDEQRERSLVEKVELRLALADDADKFEKTLDVFLAPLLLKLGSRYESVRKLVLNCLKDVLSRINALPDVKLPVRKLLLQAQDPALPSGQDAANVRLYSLLMASKGVSRMSLTDCRDMVPLVMSGISTMPQNSAARLFHILCKLILRWKAPLRGTKEEEDTKLFLQLKSHDDYEYLLQKFTKFLMMIPTKIDTQSGLQAGGYTAPGLSASEVSFFTYLAGVNFTKVQLAEFKAAIFKFVTSGFVSRDQDLCTFLIIASADSSALSDTAVQLLKLIKIPYEDAKFISSLTSLYIGVKKTGTPPVRDALKEKILKILNSSVLSTENPEIVSLICSIGLQSVDSKIRSLCLSYVQFVAKHNSQNLFMNSSENVAQTNIASLIRNNLNAEGWPRFQNTASPNMNMSAALLYRRQEYETLGEVLKRYPELLEDMSFIEFLFDSLNGDLSEFRASIQEALLGLVNVLGSFPNESKKRLQKLIRRNFFEDDITAQKAERNEKTDSIMASRYVCIKYINATFDFDDVEARMLNILGTSQGNRFDIIEESFKGLHPHWFRVNKASLTTEYVPTNKMLASEVQEIAFPQASSLLASVIENYNSSFSMGDSLFEYCLCNAVQFCKQAIISNATYKESTVIIQDEDWSLRIEKALEMDGNVAQLVRRFLSLQDSRVLTEFMSLLCNEFVLKDENNKNISISRRQDIVFGQTLLELARFLHEDMLRQLEPLLGNLYKYVGSASTNYDDDIDNAANILGVIGASNLSSKVVVNILTDVGKLTTIDTIQPALHASAYIIPRIFLHSKGSDVNKDQVQALLKQLLSLLQSGKHRSTALKLFSQVSKFGLLLHLDKDERITLVKQVMDYVQSWICSNELAVELWGYLSLYADNVETFKVFFKKLYDAHTSKHVEFLFTTGEAMSVLAAGWKSLFLTRQIDVPCDISFLQEVTDDTRMAFVVEEVILASDSSKPNLRKSSCIWLLSLVQYAGASKIVISKCRDIHLRFMRFLADRDELIQESASRGLSMVYELGDADLKEDMIKGLLKSFTESANSEKLAAGSISENTELFDTGLLNTGDGSISTYKDILNLASEVGDPALVYKFMSLAKSSSLWSSRKGLAFGLGAIMSKSSLQEYLLNEKQLAVKLVPKLYRYRFDPFTAVSRSMNDIWSTLINDSSYTISISFDEILQEVLSGMSSKEWRVREASALALLNLVQTQPHERFSDHLIDIWTMAFRSMDDIKESVRQAGTQVTTALAKILARSIDTSKGANDEKSKKTLESILPFLLGSKGLNSDAEDVRNFALTILVDLVKNAGKSISPFAPGLVYDFTLLFSSIEPQVVNYLTLHAKNYNIDESIIDAQRKNGVRSSPLFQNIEILITQASDEMVEEYVNSILKAIKKSVGLPSKVAASMVVVLLVRRFRESIKQFAGKLLKSCFAAFDDRNSTIGVAFAQAAGYIFGESGLDKAVKYGKQLEERYFTSTTDSEKIVVGTAIGSIYKNSHSQFQNISTILMPLLFVAANDDDENVRNIFQDTLTEASSSGSGTVKLYVEEIIGLISKYITSTDYKRRKTCAKAASALSNKVDVDIPTKQVASLFNISTNSLSGRSWDGKEVVLNALIALTKKFKSYVADHSDLEASIQSILTIELSRKNNKYVNSIIAPCCEYLSVFASDSMVEVLIDVSKRLVDSVDSAVDTSESANKRIKKSSTVSQKSSKENVEKEEYILRILIACAVACKPNENYPQNLFLFILETIRRLFQSENILYTWRSQIAICEIASTILDNCTLSPASEEFTIDMERLWDVIYQYNAVADTIESVHVKFISFAGQVTRKVPSIRGKVEKDLSKFGEQELSAVVKIELQNIGIIV